MVSGGTKWEDKNQGKKDWECHRGGKCCYFNKVVQVDFNKRVTSEQTYYQV